MSFDNRLFPSYKYPLPPVLLCQKLCQFEFLGYPKRSIIINVIFLSNWLEVRGFDFTCVIESIDIVLNLLFKLSQGFLSAIQVEEYGRLISPKEWCYFYTLNLNILISRPTYTAKNCKNGSFSRSTFILDPGATWWGP